MAVENPSGKRGEKKRARRGEATPLASRNFPSQPPQCPFILEHISATEKKNLNDKTKKKKFTKLSANAMWGVQECAVSDESGAQSSALIHTYSMREGEVNTSPAAARMCTPTHIPLCRTGVGNR